MNRAIFNGVVIDEVRNGWSMACTHCRESIRYTILNIQGGREPFLYCDRSSDFVLRDEDVETVARLVGPRDPELSDLRAIYDTLEQQLDPRPGGGRFNRWSDVRCPHCGTQVLYAGGVRSEDIRYFEDKVIWVEGATAFRGSRMNSNRLASVQIK